MTAKRNRPASDFQDAALRSAKQRLESLLKIREKRSLQVRHERGHLVVYRKERFPGQRPEWVRALRLTPIGAARYGLSVCSTADRWERTPFSGELSELVQIMTTVLGHFLADPW